MFFGYEHFIDRSCWIGNTSNKLSWINHQQLAMSNPRMIDDLALIHLFTEKKEPITYYIVYGVADYDHT